MTLDTIVTTAITVHMEAKNKYKKLFGSSKK